MSLILFLMRSTKLNKPLTRILVRGSLDFFSDTLWNVKTKKIKPERYKSLGNGARFLQSCKKILGMVREMNGPEFAPSLVSLIPDSVGNRFKILGG
jgi:hypothetical protein